MCIVPVPQISDKVVVTCRGGKPGKKLKTIIEYKDEVSCNNPKKQNIELAVALALVGQTQIRAGGRRIRVQPGQAGRRGVEQDQERTVGSNFGKLGRIMAQTNQVQTERRKGGLRAKPWYGRQTLIDIFVHFRSGRY